MYFLCEPWVIVINRSCPGNLTHRHWSMCECVSPEWAEGQSEPLISSVKGGGVFAHSFSSCTHTHSPNKVPTFYAPVLLGPQLLSPSWRQVKLLYYLLHA